MPKRPRYLRRRSALLVLVFLAREAVAEADGATLGSKTLAFTPGLVRPGNDHFAIGTAGSGL
jgi:RNA 3'-terminal phosphate cyclase